MERNMPFTSLQLLKTSTHDKGSSSSFTIDEITRPDTMSRRSSIVVVTVLGVFLVLLLVSHTGGQIVDNDEYVREVLEEDRLHYYGEDDDYVMYQDYEYLSSDGTTNDENDADKYRQQKQQIEAERIQMEEDRRAQEDKDRLAAQRERQFQAELDRMNEEQRKAALRSKRKDKRRVHAVLKAAKNDDLYGVLGLRNWNISIPGWRISLPGATWGFTIPPVTIKETTEKDIRRQFRTMSKLVHPDKNRDGRATEAFIAVEAASAVLSDPTQRALYDEERKQRRAKQLDSGKQLVSSTVHSTWKVSGQIIKTTHTMLGPFATPVFIIAFLVA
jgi:DnaJ domain